MQRSITITTFLFLLAIIFFAPVKNTMGGLGQIPLINCRDLAFSTEDDFLTQGPEPADGNPIISDGDLLGLNGRICARNDDLLSVFEVKRDLGLDAVHVMDA